MMIKFFRSIVDYSKNFFQTLIDFLMPRSAIATELMRMSKDEFIEKAGQQKEKIEIKDWTVISIFDYRNAFVKEAIWQIKYKCNGKILKLISSIIYDHIISEISEKAVFENFTKPIAIPVPLSYGRQRSRGFNQSALLVQELSKLDLGNLFESEFNILTKIRDTPNQTSLKRSVRLKNVLGCFGVSDKEKIRNQNIILIDDVTTTGATLSEARQTLLSAGAREVVAFTIAH